MKQYVTVSRESYLASLVEWKQDYTNISQEIREVRQELRDVHRAFSKGQTTLTKLNHAIGVYENRKSQARELLETRQTMKENSRRAWEYKQAILRGEQE